MRYLKDQLQDYRDSGSYPFHMPGHKRRGMHFSDPAGVDITEIDGFDNLHGADGVLKDAQDRAAALYGSDRCFYLVNGSTCGLLAAVCAAVKKRGKLLLARNCHRAVYHAVFLSELTAVYVSPVITGNDLQGQITPEQVSRVLKSEPDIAAVIVTSPTYEGIVSDVAGIAAAVHEHGIPLIVDEAHGAHFGFGGGFPENAVRLGADAVVMSLHKTLPSFTQTALLHLNGERIDAERVEMYLSVFETSSPSYLFLAGMDECVRLIRERGEELFSRYRGMLDDFYESAARLRNLHVMTRADLREEEAFDRDDGKIIIFSGEAGISGGELYQRLRAQYGLQMEMASGNYVLGMTSIMDEPEGFRRLVQALSEIDSGAAGGDGKSGAVTGFTARMYQENPRKMDIFQALEAPCANVPFSEACGRISAGFIFLYPPGIPVLVPGEEIGSAFVERICECHRQGLRVEGTVDFISGRIKIVYF